MNKKIPLGAALAFSVIVASIAFVITWTVSTNKFAGLVAGTNQGASLYEKLDEIDQYANNNYLNDVDDTDLQDSLARGYLAGLGDPYAAYYTAETLQNKQQDMAGYITGIGVAATQDASGYIKIISVYEDSPAQAAGIEVGDLIVAVDGEDIKTLGFSEGVSLMQGDAGTSVMVTVRHSGEDSEIELIRKKMEIPSVTYRLIGEDGYIKISSFKATTVEQFQTALDELKAQGATGLIFDLRNNTGGTLDSVCEILDILLPEGTLGTIETKDGTITELASSDADEIDLPMVVLGNSETASAAELFIAAFRDYDKGSFVGTKTYGKGVMQTLHTLSDGSAVSITTAYFNPPKSANFNAVGIVPDYEVVLSDSNQKLYASGGLSDQDDTQLMKAIEVLETAK